MTVSVKITSDVKKATRFLNNLQRRQIPFATSLALNKTAESIQRFTKSRLRSDLDNPTPQVQRSIRLRRSTKKRLSAKVFILPAIARFMRFQIEGGSRSPRGRVEAIPVNLRLNRFGNIPGRRLGKLRKILAKPDTFSARINGVAGIWQRGRGKRRNKEVKLIAGYETSPLRYRPRYPFYQYAEQRASRAWPPAFRRSLKRALRTMRAAR